MRDKRLEDVVELTDQMASLLSETRMSSDHPFAADKERLLKTWNIMRQSMGATFNPAERMMGREFNEPQSNAQLSNVVYLNTGTNN